MIQQESGLIKGLHFQIRFTQLRVLFMIQRHKCSGIRAPRGYINLNGPCFVLILLNDLYVFKSVILTWHSGTVNVVWAGCLLRALERKGKGKDWDVTHKAHVKEA